MNTELRIISPTSMYPDISGPSMRTINIAKFANKNFQKVTLFSIGERDYNVLYDEVHIIQNSTLPRKIDKIKYHSKNILLNDFSPLMPEKALLNPNNSLFQIEEPYYINQLLKNNIHEYILNESDVFWEFAKFPTFGFKQKMYQKLFSEKRKKIEIKAIKKASHIIVCSDRDKSVILEEIPSAEEKISVVPNCINFSEYNEYLVKNSKYNAISTTNNDSDLYKVLFIGTFPYRPNIDALNVICNEISPHILNNVIIQIIGRNPPNIQYPKNLKILGYIDDIKRYILESDICIAPLRYGSGTRFKILEYMAMGKPIISTSKGAEGLNYENYSNIIIEDNFNKYPQIIKELIENPSLMKNLGENAKKLVSTQYDWKCYSKILDDIYSSV